ncbi:rhomboid family intramembrane serine protease [Acidobacteria bacterium AB60]|nr:rhomboid family intramembrane serine protease [Acidobacteria bacterium AB60]
MARMSAMQLGLPEFRGATRRLVLVNLIAYFGLLVFDLAHLAGPIVRYLAFIPELFLHGYLWQPLTYSFIHTGMLGTLFELLSLWFLVSFLEAYRGASWVTSLYAVSVLGTAISGAVIYDLFDKLGHPMEQSVLTGCMGGIFGLLVAIGVLYGDTEFLMFFLISVKARYLAAIYALIAFASLFGQNRLYAFAQLGGAVAGLLYIRFAPRQGFGFAASEWMYGLRNGYYRWKRRRAGRKFEVYMRKQGRDIRLDSRGRPMQDDPNDRGRWN